ncbi:MAG TPA: hypothetical protein VK081_14090, partial [Planctomycetota bacterium]|nr:hypothetical protein [Planctomycetota bacterium]
MNGAAAPPPRATSFRAGCLGVALVALVAWWPLSAYWQSDDFLAVTYAADWRRALADFTGNQYGTPALVWFYRPLITLSFAIDAWLGGADPFVAHCSNVVAHAVSTVLVALLGRRLLGAGPGLGLALLFSLWPAHAGSILWAVGRVDSHTTMWILLACFATVRWLDSGRGRTLALGAFALALLSKELAFVTPVLAGLLGFALGAPGARVRRAWQAAWPLLVLFAVYLVWRRIVLGRFVGGYQDAAFEPV